MNRTASLKNYSSTWKFLHKMFITASQKNPKRFYNTPNLTSLKILKQKTPSRTWWILKIENTSLVGHSWLSIILCYDNLSPINSQLADDFATNFLGPLLTLQGGSTADIVLTPKWYKWLAISVLWANETISTYRTVVPTPAVTLKLQTKLVVGIVSVKHSTRVGQMFVRFKNN